LPDHNDAPPLGPSNVLAIYAREPRPNITPGRFEPCPTRFCAATGCDGTMELVLSHDEYPDGDPDHSHQWPYMYRRWVCPRDKSHFANVSADEWQAVQQFARDQLTETQATSHEWGLVGNVVGGVLLVPALFLVSTVLVIKRSLEVFVLLLARSPKLSSITDPSAAPADVVINLPPSKSCTAAGCGGTMIFHPPRVEAPDTAEWPWRATWVCESNAGHFEIATAAEESAARRSG
jgi:hypothetical protein